MSKEYIYLDDDINVQEMRVTAELIGIKLYVGQLLSSDEIVLKDMRIVMKIAELLGMDVIDEIGKVLK